MQEIILSNYALLSLKDGEKPLVIIGSNSTNIHRIIIGSLEIDAIGVVYFNNEYVGYMVDLMNYVYDIIAVNYFEDIVWCRNK